MAKGKKLTEEEIGKLANAEIQAAVTYDGTDFQKNRVRAMEYWRGEMRDLEHEDGLSEAVSHDVQDVMGWILPGLMRVFFSAEDLGIYEPENEEDEDSAKQATDYATYIVMRECNGYEVFWDVFHDALLHANGIVKHWWEDTDKVTVHFATGLDDDQFAALVNSDEIEIIEHREDQVALVVEQDDADDLPLNMGAPGAGGPMPPAMNGTPPGAGGPMPPAMNGAPMAGGPGPQPGADASGLLSLVAGAGNGAAAPPMPPLMAPTEPQFQTLHSVKVRRTRKIGKLMIKAVPPEEFLINIQARGIEDARFVGHRMTKTRSELIEAGYDPDVVADLPATTFPNYANLPQTRVDSVLPYQQTVAGLDSSMEECEITEAYMRMDIDGDGIAENVKIVMAGPNTNVVLDHEIWEDEVPFTDFVAERVPHRWQGRSVFDDTQDIQRIKSTLLRQFLDNLYHSNIPDRAVQIERIANPDALADRRIGNVIHTEGPPSEAIADLAVPFAAKEALTGLQYMDEVIERRTGVSKSTMALDLEALQNQSATAVNAAQSASYTKIELIARNFAEMGFTRFFECILKLIVAHQEAPRRIKIKRNWVTMDPSSWNANMKFSVNVGLGSGSRDRDAAILMQVAQKQEQINMQLGPDNPLCGLDKYANTLRSLVQMAMPSADPDKYFNELEPEKVAAWQQQRAQNQPPDPKAQAEMMKAQAAQQKAQQDAQIKMQTAQQDIQLRQQTAAADAQLEQQKGAAKMQAERERNQLDMQAAREKNAFQLQADREAAAQDAQQKQQEALLDAQLRRDEMLIEAELTREANRMNAQNTSESNRWNADNTRAHNSAMAKVAQRKADVNINRQRTRDK